MARCDWRAARLAPCNLVVSQLSPLGKLGAALALVAAFWGHGFYTGDKSGRADEIARTIAQIVRLEKNLADVTDANRAAAAIIEASRIAQATLAQELENEARLDPDAVRRVPSPDSLRRLERRWIGAR